MRVRMLASEPDRHTGTLQRYVAGEEYDVPQKVAESWIRAGVAVKVTRKRTTKGGK